FGRRHEIDPGQLVDRAECGFQRVHMAILGMLATPLCLFCHIQQTVAAMELHLGYSGKSCGIS
ncbi:MAG TPA: hypothetical protein DDX04_10455, partial [Massilia sp.]|nr:hypothetical protein [Massilia sp.]